MHSFRQKFVVGFGVAWAIVLCLSPSVGQAAATDGPVLRAGAATSDITPPLGVPIVGNWTRPAAANIHDKLLVRCLVLDDGDDRLAIAICDNLHIPREIYDEARDQVVEKTGIPAANILLASTHTHSAAEARSPLDSETVNYREVLVRGMVEAVTDAIKSIEPAQIAWGRAEEPGEVFNRRWHMKDPKFTVNPFGEQDQVRMNPPRGNPALDKPAGPTDPEIAFLSVRANDGRPIALLANYSLHYVGGVPAGDISADYFGVFAERIGALLGADQGNHKFVGILSNGTSGDINNLNFRNPRGKKEPYEQINHVANLVATRVHTALQDLDYHDHVDLGARMSTLTLEARKPDEATMEWARGILAKPESETERKQRIYAGRMQGLSDGPDTVEILVQSFRIGEVGIATSPFETFAETGLHLKKTSPLPHTFTISHANGANGYLPTPAQHELGGYETWLGTNRVEVDSEPKLVETLLAQLGEMAGK